MQRVWDQTWKDVYSADALSEWAWGRGQPLLTLQGVYSESPGAPNPIIFRGFSTLRMPLCPTPAGLPELDQGDVPSFNYPASMRLQQFLCCVGSIPLLLAVIFFALRCVASAFFYLPFPFQVMSRLAAHVFVWGNSVD